MAGATGTPDDWSLDHSKAFLLICAAGVDGFHPDELGSIMPILRRMGVPHGQATVIVSEAFSQYKRHAANDTVEDALVLHALQVKRGSSDTDLRAMLDTLHEVSRIDDGVSEGERLVLTLLTELWAQDA
jgi:hypothetical protein